MWEYGSSEHRSVKLGDAETWKHRTSAQLLSLDTGLLGC